MKKVLKIFIILGFIFIFSFFVSSSKVFVSASTLNKEDILKFINSSVEIYNGKYDEYTDDENEVGWANFYGVNIYNYCEENRAFCGFYMDYKSKPILGGVKKGEATIHGDDPIIYLVPRELFVHRGQYTYVGKEYGFFVNTTPYGSDDELETANNVDVFIFDIITNKNNFYFEYKIRPLYVFSYIYLSEYIFYTYDNIIINNMKISLDQSVYTSYSDAIIPIPSVKNEKSDSIYGENYPQDYAKAQPNKDMYVIKDTIAYILLYNVNNLNSFDQNYDINNDKGYVITRSYITYNGYNAFSPGVNHFIILNNTDELLQNFVGLFKCKFSEYLGYAQTIVSLLELKENVFNYTSVGYEMNSLTNNPTVLYKGGKVSQRDWYKENGYEEKFWKSDIRKISSSVESALVFKPFCYNDLGFPIYNEITYHWDIESESKEEGYLIYGSNIQIAVLNKNTNTFDEVGIGNYLNYNLIGNNLSKEIDIYSEQKGYMLNGGKYDDFSFVPSYSGYYAFYAPTYSKIYLYENNKLLKTDNWKVTYIFERNVEYKFVVEINSFPQTSREYKVNIRPYTVSTTCDVILNEYIHQNYDESLLKIYCDETNIYNFELFYYDNSIRYSLLFEVYDDNMEIINKFSIQDINNVAQIKNALINNICVLLKKGNYYYVRYNIIQNFNINFKIEYVEQYDNSLEESTINAELGDKLLAINVLYTSNYQINFVFENKYNVENNMMLAIFVYSNESIYTYDLTLCKGISGGISKKLSLNQNDIIYFGFYNGNVDITYKFNCYETPNYEFTITTENENANELTGLGTEVTVNLGNRYDNKIAAGFTRVLYLGEDAIYNSRYNDYFWSSSNPDVASVSAYGSVFAKNEGTTIIRVTDKYNQNHVATLEIVVYKKESSTKIVLTTDVNSDEKLNGTEVRLNGGSSGSNIIHIGYTRSICIIANGPSNIRQDYIWTSSDSSIASIDKYGIVHARSKGIVEIKCVNKYDEKCIGIISIKVI